MIKLQKKSREAATVKPLSRAFQITTNFQQHIAASHQLLFQQQLLYKSRDQEYVCKISRLIAQASVLISTFLLVCACFLFLFSFYLLHTASGCRFDVATVVRYWNLWMLRTKWRFFLTFYLLIFMFIVLVFCVNLLI